MGASEKAQLTEAEIRTRFVTPALSAAGWPLSSLREEYFYFSAGRIQVVGSKGVRREPKRVDYLLEYRADLPVALVEAKDNRHQPGDGMQQALQYAEQLDVPSVFTTNGDSFVWHDGQVFDRPWRRSSRLTSSPLLQGSRVEGVDAERI